MDVTETFLKVFNGFLEWVRNDTLNWGAIWQEKQIGKVNSHLSLGHTAFWNLNFDRGSRKYDKTHLQEALKLQERMDANMGGTNIFMPLKSVFDNRSITGHKRQVKQEHNRSIDLVMYYLF